MQSAVKVTVSLFLLSSALASYRTDTSAKLRRDGVLNMYPFPRVGRASIYTWEVPINDILPEYEPIQKRLMHAFPRVGRRESSPRESIAPVRPVEQSGMWFGPRVGRSDPSVREVLLPIPVRRTDQSGMWFGPRLGRSFKSDDDDMSIQNELNDRSEPEQIEPAHEERRKRQV